MFVLFVLESSSDFLQYCELFLQLQCYYIQSHGHTRTAVKTSAQASAIVTDTPTVSLFFVSFLFGFIVFYGGSGDICISHKKVTRKGTVISHILSN
jgi:hypothetical protein